MSTLRYTETLEGKQFHKNADDFASEVVKRAIIFASEVYNTEDNEVPHLSVNTLVSKHVDAQLAYVKDANYLSDNSRPNLAQRTTEALETLANAHAEDGVRVNVSQPWHSS